MSNEIIIAGDNCNTLKHVVLRGLESKGSKEFWAEGGRKNTKFEVVVDFSKNRAIGVVDFRTRIRISFNNDIYIVDFPKSIAVMNLPDFFVSFSSLMPIIEERHTLNTLSCVVASLLARISCFTIIYDKISRVLTFGLYIPEIKNGENRLQARYSFGEDLKLVLDFPEED